MKYIAVTFLSLFLYTQAFAQKAGNDRMRYGLHGKVKTMEQTVFSFAKEEKGQWQVPDTPYYMVEKYHFDKKGMLLYKEDRNIHLQGDKKQSYVKMIFNYQNERIAGSDRYDDQNRKLGGSITTWKDNHTYIDSATDNVTKSISVATHILDKKYRNKEVITRRWGKDGRLEQFVMVTFTYGKGNMLTGQTVRDSLFKATFTYSTEVLKKDRKGNVLKQAFTSTGDYKMPPQLIFYKYEYY